MKRKIGYGEFCNLYGKTIRNRIIEHLLELGSLDFSVGDLAEEVCISRPKAYETIKEIEKQGLVKKSRIVSGTQLYKLDESKSQVKQLRKDFNQCLNRVIEEYSEKPKATISGRTGLSISAKGI
jgi:sugar-specific transcriptional regulator TrmB